MKKLLKKLKKIKFSKLIVALIILLNIAFTITVLAIFAKTGTEPMTLIGCWFAFTGTELVSLAGIKKKEIQSSNEEN